MHKEARRDTSLNATLSTIKTLKSTARASYSTPTGKLERGHCLKFTGPSPLCPVGDKKGLENLTLCVVI